MKPSKTRVRNRQKCVRWLQLGDELELRANLFARARSEAVDKPQELRKARHWLFRAALDFAAAVDGEEG